MHCKIQLLDCTLRDGSYIVNGDFSTPVLTGILRKLTAARVDIIECGWLKNTRHTPGSAFFHIMKDAEAYIPKKNNSATTYAVMMDWDRYDLTQLSPCSGAINAIRVVFPQEKFKEAIPLGKTIKDKGYRLFFQAANTLGYSDEELKDLAHLINEAMPESLSIVDTFGAMYPEDLERIFLILNKELCPQIKLGFHSHNNQQLSFALSMEFVRLCYAHERDGIVDASLCGMGRGAGNTTTELLANFLNRKYHCDYDMNEIMDTIDLYMTHLNENYHWGYSIPYCIAGIYGTHVNNIAYLQKTHQTLARDMRIIIGSMTPEKRKTYDYANLEKIYVDYQNRLVEDQDILDRLTMEFQNQTVLLLGPGRTLTTHRQQIMEFIQQTKPMTIGINAVPDNISFDKLFFVNPSRYLYAQETMGENLTNAEIILTSNVKRIPEANESIVNFNLLCKLGWVYFDNACIMCLRLMAKLKVKEIIFAGFDGFPEEENPAEFYADKVAQPAISSSKRRKINVDVAEMLEDFVAGDKSGLKIRFLTPSRFEDITINAYKAKQA